MIKLVIARGKKKRKLYFNEHHDVVVNEKLSFLNITLIMRKLKGFHIK